MRICVFLFVCLLACEDSKAQTMSPKTKSRVLSMIDQKFCSDMDNNYIQLLFCQIGEETILQIKFWE